MWNAMKYCHKFNIQMVYLSHEHNMLCQNILWRTMLFKRCLDKFFFSFFFDKLYEKKKPLKCGTCYNNFSGKQTLKRHLLKGFSRALFKRSAIFFSIISQMKNLDQWLTKRYLLSRKLLISCQGFKVVIKIRSELQRM